MIQKILILLLLCTPAFGATVFVSQSGGSVSCGADGTQSTTAQASVTWTAGNTYKICGTITSEMTIGASGSAGNLITILFESNGGFSAAAFNPAAIELANRSFILIDGGTACGTIPGNSLSTWITSCSSGFSGTAILQNTANGTSLGNNIGTIMIDLGQGSCGNDIEIRNLLILNVYVKTSTSDEGAGASNSEGVFGYACGNNILIHDNTITYAHLLEGLAPSNGSSNYQLYNNVLRNATWGINAQIGGSNIVGSNLYIYNNDINDGAAWSDPSGTYHIDGVFVFGQNSTGYWNGAYVYNNYLHGDWVTGGSGQCPTGHMYINQNLQNFYIFNNIDSVPSSGTCNGQLAIGYQDNNFFIYNNTFQGNSGSTSGCCAVGDAGAGDTNVTVENNILAHIVTGENLSHASATATIDYNDNYDILGTGQPCNWANAATCSGSFTAWQTAGNDTHGAYADPKLTSDFALQTGSGAIGLGKNLFSTCNGQPNPGLGALCFDQAGNARPSSGAWDAGAFYFTSGTATPAPAPAVMFADNGYWQEFLINGGN